MSACLRASYRHLIVEADNDGHSPTKWGNGMKRILLLATACVFFSAPAHVHAQRVTVVATVPTGSGPSAVAINSYRNKIYVANSRSNNVTVIDRATNKPIDTVDVGRSPAYVAVNPWRDKIYVTNHSSNTVTVIDGSSNAVDTTLNVGTGPYHIAVNVKTGKVYVANAGDGSYSDRTRTVTVIDSTNNMDATVTVGYHPGFVAVDTMRNKVYVACSGEDSYESLADAPNVMVIDGATNTVIDTLIAGAGPYAIAINADSGKVYVTSSVRTPGFMNPSPPQWPSFARHRRPPTPENWWPVSVFDAESGALITRVMAGQAPGPIAVNVTADRIYAANIGGGNVTVIDGSDNAVVATVGVGATPQAIAVDQVTYKAFVANSGSNSVTMISGADNRTTTVNVGVNPQAMAFNPGMDRLYVANYGSDNLTVINTGP